MSGRLATSALLAGLLLCGARSASADPVVLFDTFGPSPGYVADSAYGMSDQNASLMGFQLTETARLLSVTAPARWHAALAGGMTISIWQSIDGLPDFGFGGVLERIAVPRPPDAGPGVTSVLTAVSAVQPVLSADTLYFLGLHVCCAGVDVVSWPWNNAGIQGTVVRFLFPPGVASTGTLAAFRLEGEPIAAPVPEPGTLLLVATGVGLVARSARRRKQQRCFPPSNTRLQERLDESASFRRG